MTVLQTQDAVEENQLPIKKARLSGLRRDDSRQSMEAWKIAEAKSKVKSSYLSRESIEINPVQKPASPDQIPLQTRNLSPIAQLNNLGNTCFLNSVLYTLRYTPSFLHKLHHLNSACEFLIRRAPIEEGFYLLGNGVKLSVKTRAAFSQLHKVYTSLCLNEMEGRKEAFEPDSFLRALSAVNPMFEGNQQHDVHELLGCIFNIFREICESLKFSKIIRSDERTTSVRENHSGSRDDINILSLEDHLASSQSTLFDDFCGVSLLQTTCLECEHVTGRKETLTDILLPIKPLPNCDGKVDVDYFYQSLSVTEDYLTDRNKYKCEKCSHYNEAKRSVKFEKLPKLLILQLERFRVRLSGLSTKVTDYMPTPLSLSCFCEECLQMSEECLQTKVSDKRRHVYKLYAIIVHCGISSHCGHYMTYVKQTQSFQDYMFCTKDEPKPLSLPRRTSIDSVVSNNNNMLNKGNTFKYSIKLSSEMLNGSSESMNSREVDMENRVIPLCEGSDCCSIRRREMNDLDHTWLLLNDAAKIEFLSTENLLAKLSPTSVESDDTPYLLFYSRVDS